MTLIATITVSAYLLVAQPGRAVAVPVLVQEPALALLQTQVQSTHGSGRSAVPSDFFEDALAAAPVGSGSQQAPYDVGHGAVPLPNEFESLNLRRPNPSLLSLTPHDREDSAALAAAAAVGGSAARQSTIELADEDAGPLPQQALGSGLRAATPSGARAHPSLAEQFAQETAQLEARREAQQRQARLASFQQQRVPTPQEIQQELDRQRAVAQQEAEQAMQQDVQQQAQQQALQQSQQQAQPWAPQQQQQQQRQLARLDAQRSTQHTSRQELPAAPATSSASAADSAAEATRFFEDQGDLGGEEPEHDPVRAEDVHDPMVVDPLSQQDLALGQPLPPQLVTSSSASQRANAFDGFDAVKGRSFSSEYFTPPAGEDQREQASQDASLMNLQSRGASEARSAEAPVRKASRGQSFDGTAIGAGPRGQQVSPLEEELRMLHEKELFLQSLEQNLLRNVSAYPGATAAVAGVNAQRASQPSFLAPSRVAAPRGTEVSATARGRVAMPQKASDDLMPKHEHCTPQCSWKCTNPKCDEQCKPVCQTPNCQTRCMHTDLTACRMECGRPQCSVLCPKKPCAGIGCAPCTTKCSEPMCMLQCPRAQPCRNVCEHPQCSWKCEKPTSCPKPQCSMSCEAPGKCMGSTFRKLPALRSGEILVQSFRAPSGLGSHPAGSAALRGGAAPTQAFPEDSPVRASPAAEAALLDSQATVAVPVESIPDDFSSRQWRHVPDEARSPRHQRYTVRMPVVMAEGHSQPVLAEEAQQLGLEQPGVSAFTDTGLR